MRNTSLLLIPLFALAMDAAAQTCSCESNFLWAKKTFEENDAGFSYIIKKKGREAYEMHNRVYLEKVKKLPNNSECAATINQWIRFFRNGHIGIQYLKSDAAAQAIQTAPATEATLPEGVDKAKYEKAAAQLNARKPFFEKLDATTAYLRIPFFEISEKKLIDSVIRQNRDVILSTENLIIDLRNNPGGSDASFEQLLPILYTNPVRTVGVEFLSTQLNNQRMLDLTKMDEFDEDSRKMFKTFYDTLSAHPGEFVNLFGKDVNISKRDTVYPYPKRVGIIIHNKNGSTTEQFLLAAKQSQKVKFFGRTTYGMLDISNVHIVPSPCKDFELYYGLSRTIRIPDFAIDDIGLQPDYFIDRTVKDYQWVDFVAETLNNGKK